MPRNNLYRRRSRPFLAIQGGTSRSSRVSLIDQLEHDNDLQKLNLSSIHAMMNSQKLLKAIQSNTSVTIVNIDGFFMENFTVRHQIGFWDAIAALPKQEQLHINYFLDLELTSSILQRVVGNALRLTNLSIHDTKLRHYSDLTMSFKDHKDLTTISITQLELSEEQSHLGSLLSTCFFAPNLQKFTLRMAKPQMMGFFDPVTINQLAQKSLKTLELRRVLLDNNSLIQVMETLIGNKTALAGSLRELILECDEMNASSCAAVGRMLQSNCTLLHLELWGWHIDPSGIKFITNALKTNRMLKVLQMSHVNIGLHGQEYFCDMLQHNFFLESIVLQQSFHDTKFLKTLDFFLKMNMTQIRRLMLNVNATTEQIFDKILVHASNLGYVYHLLRGNPGFISPR